MAKDQGYLVPKKSVFNRIIGDSQLELRFAAFLEDCSDVVSYAKNYLAVHFKLDYVNADGDISNYYPDFMVKLSDKRIVIVETKGQEDLDVPLKMARLRQWCEDINRVQTDVEYDFVYVDEESFEKYKPTSFRQLLEGFKEYPMPAQRWRESSGPKARNISLRTVRSPNPQFTLQCVRKRRSLRQALLLTENS